MTGSAPAICWSKEKEKRRDISCQVGETITRRPDWFVARHLCGDGGDWCVLCTSGSVECGVSATPRRLDWRHEARGSGSECLASEHLVLYAMLNCVLRQRCQVQMCPPVSDRAGVPAAHRCTRRGPAEEGAVPTPEGRQASGRESEVGQ